MSACHAPFTENVVGDLTGLYILSVPEKGGGPNNA